MKRTVITVVLALGLFLLMMPMAVSAASGVAVVSWSGDGKWVDGNIWQVEVYPGETKATTLSFYNSSSSSLDVEASVSPASLNNGSLVFELDKAGFTMLRRSYTDVTLTIKASGSATPGTYTTELTIKSEVPPKPSPPTPVIVEPEEEEPAEEPEVVEPEEPEEPEEEESEVIEPEEEEPEPIEPEEEEPIEPVEPIEPEEPEELIPIEEPSRWGLLDSILAGLVFVALGLVIWQWRRRNKGKRGLKDGID